MVNINLLNTLLNNYINVAKGIEATVLITKDGVVITSIIGKEMAEEEIGGIAHLIRYITDVLVFNSTVEFEKTSRELSTQQHNFLFRQVSPDIMFVSICKPEMTIETKAYSEYCAKKIEKILQKIDVAPDIPTMKLEKKEEIKDEYVFKICVLGNAGVGKTTSITQFVESKFETDYKPTIGTSIVRKVCVIDKSSLVHLQIWDIAGQDIWEKMRKVYYAGSQGALILFDVTRPNTFDDVTKWLEEFTSYTNLKKNCILVGNKIDLVEERKITYDEGSQKASELGMPYIETSAKTKENIDKIFINLSKNLIE